MHTAARHDEGLFRLAVDRVFTLAGSRHGRDGNRVLGTDARRRHRDGHAGGQRRSACAASMLRIAPRRADAPGSAAHSMSPESRRARSPAATGLPIRACFAPTMRIDARLRLLARAKLRLGSVVTASRASGHGAPCRSRGPARVRAALGRRVRARAAGLPHAGLCAAGRPLHCARRPGRAYRRRRRHPRSRSRRPESGARPSGCIISTQSNG